MGFFETAFDGFCFLMFSVILGREALSRSNFYKIDALMPLACTLVWKAPGLQFEDSEV